MKEFTKEQVADIVRLKFGGMVESEKHTSYVPNWKLGKMFKCSVGKIRSLYTWIILPSSA